jgi:polyisoprenoid-binding protein YceI
MTTQRRIVLLAPLALAATLAFGQAQVTWNLDKAHSAVKFSVAHLVISEVAGQFKDFAVTLTAADEEFAGAKLTATIKTTSVFTDNERRDGHLRSADFLDVERCPEMTFVSTSFEKTGDGTYKINGDLTLRGVTRPVVLDALYKGRVKAWGKTIDAFSATTEINRFDFGVKWDAKIESGGLVAGEKVKIELTYEGVKQ